MNTFGTIFKLSLFGESHNESIGIIIDGIPPGISLSVEDFKSDISRRKAGFKGTTPRIEADTPIIKSGLNKGFTTGTPLFIEFANNNIKSEHYDSFKDFPRPGHSDFVSKIKYMGFADMRGGGHSSGRLTLLLVAAGVIAKKVIERISPSLSIESQIISLKGSSHFDKEITQAISLKDSIGGVVECIVKNVPIGLGEPFFDSLESRISAGIFAIPGVRAIEFGSGVESSKMYGSEHNDSIIDITGKTLTNNSGGINGGLSNGNNIIFRTTFKPTSSILKEQKSFNFQTREVETFSIKGRHDVCFALRTPVIVEAVAMIVILDMLLLNNSKAKKIQRV